MAHDGRLVLEDGQVEVVGDDVELLVAQDQPVHLGVVSQQVERALQVGHSHDLPPNVVVEAVDAVGVDETVSHPRP